MANKHAARAAQARAQAESQVPDDLPDLPDIAEDDEGVEEIRPEPRASGRQTVTFVMDQDDDGEDAAAEETEEYEDEDEDEDEEDGEEYSDEDVGDEDPLAGAFQQLAQLLVTEEGESLAEVQRGLRDSADAGVEALDRLRETVDKQNKILYRGVQLLELLAAKKK